MPNWLKNAWGWANTSLIPDSMAQPVEDAIDHPTLDRSPLEASLRGFGAGALEGLRQQVTPLNALALLTGSEGGSAVKSLTGLGKAAPGASSAVQGAASAGRAMGTSAAGAADLLNPGTMGVMEGMYQRARPTFQAMERSGAFAGDRSVGNVGNLARTPLETTLGELNPEFTAQGAERLYNRVRPAASHPDPVLAGLNRLLAQRGQ